MQNEAAADVVDGDTLLHEGDGVSALQLPPTVSPAQVEVWRRAGRTDSASNDIALCDLCTVLQVANALSDTRQDSWLRMLAQRLATAHLTADVCRAVAAFPDRLQADLFATLTSASSCTVATLLRLRLGAYYHGIQTHATSSPTSLTLLLHESSDTVLDALTALPTDPPALLSLTLDSQHDDLEPATPSTRIDRRIRQALLHHTGLTSLSLSHSTPSRLAILAPAISALTRMCRLELGCIGSRTGSSLPLLQRIFRRLPLLRHVNLYEDAGPEACTDPSAIQPEPPHSPVPLFSLFHASAATALTSLHIQQNSRHVTAVLDVVLPHLNHLEVRGVCTWHAAAPILQRLQAPLTSILLQDDGRSSGRIRLTPDRIRSRDLEEATQLLTRLSEFSGLRNLSAVVPSCSEDAPQWGNILQQGFSRFRQLRRLQVTAGVDVLGHAVPAVVSVATRLESLRVTCYCHSQTAEPVGERWKALLENMSLQGELSQLGDLHLAVVYCPDHSLTGIGSVFESCSGLTSLTLTQHWCCLSSAEVKALARLTGLELLSLEGVEVEVESHHLFAEALGKMAGLRELSLTGAFLSDAFAEQLSWVMPAWTALRRLTLGCSRMHAGLWALVRAASTPPGLLRLSLLSHEPGESQHVSAAHGPVEGPVRRRSGPLLPDEAEQLRGLAADLAVPLTYSKGATLS